MQKEKGISTLATVLIIVVVAIIAVGGVFAYQYFLKSQISNLKSQINSNAQNPNTQTAGSPVQNQQATEGWKTYTNNDYGFQINYPQNYKVTESGLRPSSLGVVFGNAGVPYIGDIDIMVIKNNKSPTQYFHAEETTALSGFASKCQTCANMDADAKVYNCLANNPSIVKIAGQDGFFCSNLPKDYGPNITYIFNNGYIYEFFNYDKLNPDYKIYSEMLFTFKFTK